MNTRKILSLAVIFLLVASKAWGVDKVFLKSGKIIEGEITFESSIFVRVKISPMSTREFLINEVDHVEYDSPENAVDAEDAAEGIEAVETVDIADEEENTSELVDNTDIADNDTITLKSGQTVTGTIVRQTENYIRIQEEGAFGTTDYMMHDVASINSEPVETKEDERTVVMLEKEIEEAKAKIQDESFSTPGEAAAVTAVTPTQIVISKDSPAPAQTDSYGQYGYSGGYQREYQYPQTGSAQTGMMQQIAEAPHVFNTGAYNDFLDKTLTDGEIQKQARERQIGALGKPSDIKASFFPGAGNQKLADRAKEALPKIVAAIAIGVGIPILIAFVLFLSHILKPGTKKKLNEEVNAELESLAKMKTEGKLSDEEYENLTSEAKKRITESSLKTYLVSIPKIFLYPVRMPVLLATLGATVVFYIVRFAMYAPFTGFFAVIFAYCYFVACIVKIIETAVREEKENVFDWPSFTEMVDWFGKAFLFLIGWLICHGTAVLIFINFFKYEAIRLPVISVSVTFMLIGMFVYPMYMLSMSLVGGAASLNIVNIIRAINTTYISYLITMIVLFMTQILSAIAQMIPIVHIPLFGSLFKWFIFVYFLLVNMRLLGIFYKSHRKILRWYGEDEND